MEGFESLTIDLFPDPEGPVQVALVVPPPPPCLYSPFPSPLSLPLVFFFIIWFIETEESTKDQASRPLRPRLLRSLLECTMTSSSPPPYQSPLLALSLLHLLILAISFRIQVQMGEFFAREGYNFYAVDLRKNGRSLYASSPSHSFLLPF